MWLPPTSPDSYDQHQLGPLIVCESCRRGVYTTTHRPICLSCRDVSPPLGPVWTAEEWAQWRRDHA